MRHLICMALSCLLSSPVHADPLVPQNAKNAAFYVEVTTEAVIRTDRNEIRVKRMSGGSAVCVSPDGYLLTCGHTVDPLPEIVQLLSSHPQKEDFTLEVTLHYRAGNRNGDTYTTNYQPEVEVIPGQDFATFAVFIHQMESRTDHHDSDRNLRLSEERGADLAMLEITHPGPLPFVEFTDDNPATIDGQIFAVAARERPNGAIVAARRTGYFEDQFPDRIHNVRAYRLVMTAIPGDSGAVVLNEAGQGIGLVFAHEPPEYGDITYMIDPVMIRRFLRRFNLGEGGLPILPPARPAAPPPPEEPSEPSALPPPPPEALRFNRARGRPAFLDFL